MVPEHVGIYSIYCDSPVCGNVSPCIGAAQHVGSDPHVQGRASMSEVIPMYN